MKRRTAILAAATLAAVGGGTAWWLARRADGPHASDGSATHVLPAPPGAMSASPSTLAGKPTATSTGVSPDLATSAAASGDRTVDDGTAGAAARTVRVRVHDQGRALVGATVRLRRDEETWTPFAFATTDRDGRATLATTVASPFVEAFAPGYRFSPNEWERCGDFDMDGTLAIELRRGVPFRGRVVDAGTGAPIAGASVHLSDWSVDAEIGPTDADGAFQVPGVMDDNAASVRASARGYAHATFAIRVDSGNPVPAVAVVALSRAGALVGAVRSADGQAVAGARVRVAAQRDAVEASRGEDAPSPEALVARFEARDDWGPGFKLFGSSGELTTTTATDGSFRLEGLEDATTYEATAHGVGFSTSAPVRDIRVAPGAERTVELTLRRGAVVLVRPVLPAGAVLPSAARVRVFRDDAMSRPVGRDADGRFRFTDVDPGSACAFVQTDGFRSVAVQVIASEGATSEVDVVLEAGAKVAGVVMDEEGKPLRGAEVSVAAASRNEFAEDQGRFLLAKRTATTDAAGHFSVAGVPPGDVLLVASWDDRSAGRSMATRSRLKLTAPASEVRVVLVLLGSFRARLVTQAGAPFAGEVWTRTAHGSGWGGGSDRVTDGVIEESPLDDGDYVEIVAPEGHAWIRRSFTIKDGSHVDVGDLVVDPGVAVTGRVLDAARRPLAAVRVTCVEYDDRSTVTDPEGRFRFERFPRERFTLTLSGNGFVVREVKVEPGKTTDLELQLARLATVSARFVGAKGSALPRHGCVVMRLVGASDIKRREVLPDGSTLEEPANEAWFCVGQSEPQLLAPGRYVASWVDEAEKEHRVGEWTFVEGETNAIEIVLPAK